MTEIHHPRINIERLSILLHERLSRHADLADRPPFDLADFETLLDAAEKKARPRSQLPQQLNRFPFNWFGPLQQAILKILKLLFQDQRAVNAVLIQALREQAALNRYLLARLAETRGGSDV